MNIIDSKFAREVSEITDEEIAISTRVNMLLNCLM